VQIGLARMTLVGITGMLRLYFCLGSSRVSFNLCCLLILLIIIIIIIIIIGLGTSKHS